LRGFFFAPERANSLVHGQEPKGDGDALSEAKSRRAGVAGRDRILPGAPTLQSLSEGQGFFSFRH
jgi:hypothetical protein